MSNTVKHTKGEWESEGGATQMELPGQMFWTCNVFCEREKVAICYGDTSDEAEANARLISAAPILLEALIEVSPLIDGLINRTRTGKKRDELCDLNIKVKSAIAKAPT